MRAEYLFRLDDASPTADSSRWRSVGEVFLRHGVRPIIAIVPSNSDPDLVGGREDKDFWKRAQTWAGAGWMVALHGYSHKLRPSRAGLVPLNARSEFVGLPALEQRRRIREGAAMLRTRGLFPEAWVAPAHGMDHVTLEALKTETDIRIISDSLTLRPVSRWGFVWLPQQLWQPHVMPWGLWTICLHPNNMNSNDIDTLDDFLTQHLGSITDPRAAAGRAVPYGFADALMQSTLLSALRIRRMFGRGERNGRS